MSQGGGSKRMLFDRRRTWNAKARDKINLMKQRRNITSTKVSRTWAEAEKADREFLEKLTPAERILLTWQLSEEQWKMKGVNESGLSRHHTRLIRR